jgi:hypothetical protein
VSAVSSTTEWITAVASVFAAVGTVGAVIVALWQVSRQGRRSLDVRCSSAVIGEAIPIHVVALRGTNDGSRPIKLTMAYLMTSDGRQVYSPFTEPAQGLARRRVARHLLDS